MQRATRAKAALAGVFVLIAGATFLVGLLVGRNNPADKFVRRERVMPVTAFRPPWQRPPRPADLEIPEYEDRAYLQTVVGRIFPHGADAVSPQARCIEICRFIASSLALKSNTGPASKQIRDGHAVCGGMSWAFRVLCRMVGLPSRYVGQWNIPSMGGHTICEAFYAGKWHLFDPTFGVFFYSTAHFDTPGEVVSYHDLLAHPRKWPAFQVVDRPWTGKYDDTVRAFGVRPCRDDYLRKRYGMPLAELYRRDLERAFPVAYGLDDPVSFPVDADLRQAKALRLGQVDGQTADLQSRTGRYAGSHHLSASGRPAYHTWLIRAPQGSAVHIQYHAVAAGAPRLLAAPLRGVRVLRIDRHQKATTFVLRTTDEQAVLAVFAADGTFLIDAMEIARR